MEGWKYRVHWDYGVLVLTNVLRENPADDKSGELKVFEHFFSLPFLKKKTKQTCILENITGNCV